MLLSIYALLKIVNNNTDRGFFKVYRRFCVFLTNSSKFLTCIFEKQILRFFVKLISHVMVN